MWVMWLTVTFEVSEVSQTETNKGTNRNDLTASHKNRENCDRKIFCVGIIFVLEASAAAAEAANAARAAIPAHSAAAAVGGIL